MHNKIYNSQKGELLIRSWQVKGSIYSPSKQEIVEQHSVQLHILLTRQPSAKRHSVISHFFFTTNLDNPATMLHCCIVHYTSLQNNLYPLIKAVVNKEIIIDCRALTYRVQKEANLQGDDLGGRGLSWWGCAVRFSKSWPYHRPKRERQHMGWGFHCLFCFLGCDFLPGEGIFDSFFTRRVLIDNGTGPLVDIL